MSTTPMNPTPFFGSKISLISKSEIRYEGILYTVDPKESTIALAQGISSKWLSYILFDFALIIC